MPVLAGAAEAEAFGRTDRAPYWTVSVRGLHGSERRATGGPQGPTLACETCGAGLSQSAESASAAANAQAVCPPGAPRAARCCGDGNVLGS